MHTQSKYPWLRNVEFLAVDLLAIFISFTFAFYLKFKGLWMISGDGWTSTVWARFVFLFLAADVFYTFLLTPYKGIFTRKYYMEIIQALRLAVFNAISVALLLYIFKAGEDYSRTVFILTYSFYLVVSLVMKYILKKLAYSGVIKIVSSRNPSLFVAAAHGSIDNVLVDIKAEEFGSFDIKGIYFTDNVRLDEYKGIPVISSDFVEYVVQNNISDVLIADTPSAIGKDNYHRLIMNAVNVHLNIEAMIGEQTEDQFISDVGIYRTLSVGAFTFSPGQLLYLSIKRILDFIIGLIVLILLVPLTVVIKLCSLASGDKASVFYTQKRVGQNGRPITILKYRTMVTDAESKLKELLKNEAYRKEWELNQKLANDPRITKIGRFLRKTSIDELPQALNLLKGNMSLVGPRPLVEGELEAHDGLKLYQRVKPGITGWWACNGRSDIEYRQRLELEYYYVKHFSAYLDVLCVLRTIFAVLKGQGAE